jgi:alanine racemase
VDNASRPTWAEIDLNALAHNFHAVRNRLDPDTQIMAVVKSDAYGHGAVSCARKLAAEGVNWFAVATPEEGVQLRQAGIAQPILSLGGFWNGQEEICIRQLITPVVYRLDMIESLDKVARERGMLADVHVKIDTGMGRIGVRYDGVGQIIRGLKRCKNILIDGLMTHLAAADDPDCESLTVSQVTRFDQAVSAFHERGFKPTYRHLANSAGIFGHPQTWGNMVRTGGPLYGLWRDVLPPLDRDPGLQPVMSLKSRIEQLNWIPAGEPIGYGFTFTTARRTLVAMLPIGYSDGYRRGLSNLGQVVVNGIRAPVVGRVSMDFTLIDVTHVLDVKVGDIATLLGREESLHSPVILAEDIAKKLNSLSYEVTCGISKRVPRIEKSGDNSAQQTRLVRGS